MYYQVIRQPWNPVIRDIERHGGGVKRMAAVAAVAAV
jgi:hypothetical protein